MSVIVGQSLGNLLVVSYEQVADDLNMKCLYFSGHHRKHLSITFVLIRWIDRQQLSCLLMGDLTRSIVGET